MYWQNLNMNYLFIKPSFLIMLCLRVHRRIHLKSFYVSNDVSYSLNANKKLGAVTITGAITALY